MRHLTPEDKNMNDWLRGSWTLRLAALGAEKASAHEELGKVQAAQAAFEHEVSKTRKEFDAREAAIAAREAKQAERDAWWQRVKAWLADMSAEMKAERAARAAQS